MKKLIAALLAAILLCSMMIVPVSAAGNGSLAMEDRSGKRGETVTLKVDMNSNPGLLTMTIRVRYDTSVLELIKTEDTGLLVGTQLNKDYNSPYRISWMDGVATTNNVATGTIAIFTFKIKDTAAFGKSVVTLEFLDSFDAEYGSNTFSVKSGSVTVVCDHSYGAWSKLNNDQHQRSCSKCRALETKNHDWGTGVETKPATCQATGIRTYTCSTCQATKEETIEKKNHSFGQWVKVDDGQHKRTCTVCKTETETANHAWDGGKVTKAATCKDTGIRTYTCATCKGTKEEVIPVDPTAHKFGTTWTDADDNKHEMVCTVCKTEKKQEDHRYDAGKVTKDATCKDTGIRTYTCSVCKGTKEEVIPVDPTAHKFGTTWTDVDDSKHEMVCTVCKTEKKQEDHRYDAGKVTKAATCKDTGIRTYTCADCKGTKEEVIPVDPTAHKLGAWMKQDDDLHVQNCTLCNTLQKQESHAWDGGKVTKDATCKDTGIRTYTCSVCKGTKEEVIPVKEHTFGKWESTGDTQHKRTCTMCKTETETADHSFSDTWSKDEKQHFKACECGAKKEAADHIPGPEATEQNPQLCTICNYIIKPQLGHTHIWDNKLTTDETGHWFACPGCNEKNEFKAHDFANDCDGLCETCRYTRVTEHKFGDQLVGDETGHFRACSVCGEKIDFAEHTPGEEATEDTAQTCTVCAYELVAALGHTHAFEEVWEKNAQTHWHGCVCGEKADEAEHEWADGACAVCGAQQPLHESEEPGFPWVIVVIAVLGVGAVIAAVVLLKKKK